jgi:TonB family protein
VEAFWASTGNEKLVYSFPSYSATEVHRNGKLFRTAGAGYPPQDVRTVLREVQQPMPAESEIDASQPQIEKINFGKAQLECIMLAKPIEGLAKAPMGLFPTYCFDEGKSILRADYNFGTQLVIRNGIGTFQHRNLATEIVISENKVQAVKGEVSVLRTQQVTDADLATDGLQVIDANAPVKVAGGLVAGLILSRVDPVYPVSAKNNNVQGVVVMRAVIGTDGHIHDLQVIYSPDPDLAVAALTAVRQWTYRPYMLNGVPVEIDTTINVKFTFGP